MESAFRLALQLIAFAWYLLRWLLETALLGLLLLRRIPSAVRDARVALADELECPEGHRTATYGRTKCRRCGAVRTGWVFAKCPGCGGRPVYVACPTCGNAIWNPVR